jgi:hypothetical protein
MIKGCCTIGDLTEQGGDEDQKGPERVEERGDRRHNLVEPFIGPKEDSGFFSRDWVRSIQVYQQNYNRRKFRNKHE